MTPASSQLQVSANPSQIPEAAWSRSIGLPLENPAKVSKHIHYPMVNDGPYNGAPLGGMGAGSFGRSFRGDFVRNHFNVGTHIYQSIPANMFSVYMRQGERQITQALFTDQPDTLQAWRWNYPVGAGSYYALYPRSWFVYDWEQFPAQLSLEQFSPVIAHNYRESSYPVVMFNWTATNPTDAPVTIGLMFTWQNLLGYGFGQDEVGGQQHHLFEEQNAAGLMRGVIMRQTNAQITDQAGGAMAIAALEVPEVRVSYRTRFQTKGDGADIWNDFDADGSLDNLNDETLSNAGEVLGAGVAVQFTLEPGQTLEVPFVLAWDMPVMTFVNSRTKERTSWYKRYTAFYGREGTHATEIAHDALLNRDQWRQQIIDWQEPILSDPQRPTWYKTALFNELYFLSDGATAWEHGRVGEPAPSADYQGGFLYIECLDYPHYATFDVDFYASFALLELFPELERRVMGDFVRAVAQEDLRPHNIMASGETVPRKLNGAVPHDLGGPYESPWLEANNYTFQNINRWKDLNAKFVLRLYRNAMLLEDPSLITQHWREVELAMAYLAAMDYDEDSIPENEGIPDQTYDTWNVTGVSAYSGSLWLAALAASREMAKVVGNGEASASYDLRLQQATQVYETTLWNGDYYNYDASESAYHDSVMSDQLAGQWYLDYFDMDVLPDDRVVSALRTIYRLNVLGYGDGDMGAVNGMRPDGTIDETDIQSQEMWTGTAYGLASFMLMRGMDEEAWATAHGVYRVTYETSGMWFRTPEGFDVEGNYRASLYQRPMAIWAMETAMKKRLAISG